MNHLLGRPASPFDQVFIFALQKKKQRQILGKNNLTKINITHRLQKLPQEELEDRIGKWSYAAALWLVKPTSISKLECYRAMRQR